MKTKSRKIILSVLCFALAVMMCLGLGSINNAFADTTNITVDGVSLRLATVNDNFYGLRYSATIPGAEYSESANYGFEVVPEDLKDDASKIQSALGEVESNGSGYVMSGELLNILPANTSRPFTARAFKEVDGNRVYSNWLEAKSIFTLATQALADVKNDYEGEPLTFLEGVINTVLGVNSELTGKYVYNSVSFGEKNLTALSVGENFTVNLTLKKETDASKTIKAYPIVKVLDAEGVEIADAIEQVADSQDTYTVKKVIPYGAEIVLSLVNEEIYSANINTVDEFGYVSVDFAPGQHTNPGTWGTSGIIKGSGWLSVLGTYNNKFIALGEYGVGYSVEMKFTGNNMPQVVLFANNASGSLSGGGDPVRTNNGYLVTNGVRYRLSINDTEETFADQMSVLGPNLVDIPLATDPAQMPSSTFDKVVAVEPDFINQLASAETGKLVDEQKVFTESNLEDGVEYQYVVGSRVDANDNSVIIFATLVNDSGILVFSGEEDTNKTVDEVEALGKNLLIHAGIKGEEVHTVFAYRAPVKNEYEATQNQDGSYSVKLAPGTVIGRNPSNTSVWDWKTNGALIGFGYGGDLSYYTSNYVALGEYGVGYEFKTRFVGNNLPQVMLFANNVNGYINYGTAQSYAGQLGYLIANGFAYYPGGRTTRSQLGIKANELRVYGYDRINFNIQDTIATNLTTLSGSVVTGTSLKANVEYEYTVGTEEVDGIVVIYMIVKEVKSGTVIFGGEYSTGKDKATVEGYGKNVLLGAGIKGLNLPTEFTYYTPTLAQ